MAENKNQNMMAQWFVGGALLLVAIFLVVAIVLVLTQANETPASTTDVGNSLPVLNQVVINQTTFSDGVNFDYANSYPTITTAAATMDTNFPLINPPAVGDIVYYINGSVTDLNGEADFMAGAGYVEVAPALNDGVLDPATCAGNGTNCYIAAATGLNDDADPLATECNFSATAGSGLGNLPDDNIVVFSCRVDFQHYMTSTTAIGQQPAFDWTLYAIVQDVANDTDTTTTTFEVDGTLAATVTSGSIANPNVIDYTPGAATLAVGDISTNGGSNETASFINNDGNVYTTVDISCSDMTSGFGPDILAAQQQWGTTDFVYDAVGDQHFCDLTPLSTYLTGLDMDTDLTIGGGSKDQLVNVFTGAGIITPDVDGDLSDVISVFWKIQIPNVSAGTFSGVNQLIVTQVLG